VSVGAGAMKDLTIIIVSWNVEKVLVECLESIYQNLKDISFEIIVVDNNSSDNTRNAIHSSFPDITLIENSRNVGFAPANNQAIPLSQGRYILLLNPDTLIIGNAIQQMIHYAESHPAVGLVGPRLESSNGEIQYVSGRSFSTPLTYLWYMSFLGQIFPKNKTFGKLYMTYWDHTSSKELDVITGAAMLIPRQTLLDVGILDETYPMYLEDTDYCYRVHKAGKKVYYLAESRIVHYGGQSSKQAFLDTKLMILEAHRLFYWRYSGRVKARIFKLVVISVGIIRLPVLSMVKLWEWISGSCSVKVKRINLKGEISAILWGLGLIKPKEITAIKP
jgi:GT2 family glycosyltransferase